MNGGKIPLIDGSGHVFRLAFTAGPVKEVYLEGDDQTLRFNQLGDLMVPLGYGYERGVVVKYQNLFVRGIPFQSVKVRQPLWWSARMNAELMVPDPAANYQ